MPRTKQHRPKQTEEPTGQQTDRLMKRNAVNFVFRQAIAWTVDVVVIGRFVGTWSVLSGALSDGVVGRFVGRCCRSLHQRVHSNFVSNVRFWCCSGVNVVSHHSHILLWWGGWKRLGGGSFSIFASAARVSCVFCPQNPTNIKHGRLTSRSSMRGELAQPTYASNLREQLARQTCPARRCVVSLER